MNRSHLCQDNYEPQGAWTNAQIHGYVYVVRNEGGARGKEKWGTPQILRIENGDPVEVFGNASPMLEDWDGDGAKNYKEKENKTNPYDRNDK